MRDLLPGTVIIGFDLVMTLVSVMIPATAGISDSEQGMASGFSTPHSRLEQRWGLHILVAVSTARTAAVLASLGDAADAQQSALTAGFGAALTSSAGFAIAGVLIALWVIQEADCRKPNWCGVLK